MLVTNWLTNWLTDSCLVNLIDVTLVCEDAYSKLVEIVTVAGVKDRVGNSLLQIWKLMRFGQKAKLLFQLWAQGLVKILKLKLRQELKQDWLTDSCLVNLIDVTLVCEDAYSKLVQVVTVADVYDEDRVGNSLLQILFAEKN